jgi:Rieske 2Fe-2S family protein
MAVVSSIEAPFASTLPGRYYYDPAIDQLEQERIFSQMWVCVGLADQVPNPGSYVVARLPGENVVVVRGADGALRAFLNVCRHRGARLCSDETGQVRGAFQCRYHAWSYGLDGQLVGAPNVLNAAEFDRAAWGLHPVALDCWEGMIWLNLSEGPCPLGDQIGPAIVERFGNVATFDQYRVGTLETAKTIVYEVATNWKLVVENFMECYHCAPIHPELVRLIPSFRTGGAYQQARGHEFASDVDAFTLNGRSNRPVFPSLRLEDRRRYYGVVVRPNVFVNCFPDHVLIHLLQPDGPTHSRVTCFWLFDPDVMARPDFDPTDAVEAFDLVNRQDWDVCELAQLSMASRAYRDGGIYTPIERHIRAFNDFVVGQLE